MPNGFEPRDIERVCFTIDGFRARYGHWPTILRAQEHVLEILREWLSSAEYKRLTGQLVLLSDNAEHITAEDDAGNQYHYEGTQIDESLLSPLTVIWLRQGVEASEL